ncbi:Predicted kinase, aminoglycoside phosphotransferase (APT) family [Microbacterium sp. cf046]|uniref:aminoglycoside phosphotransferase family protein n=1 Tax=Microbacterium sp. cf046 TaxID=1761803 RepID=UPI0008E5F81E|nr:aminoglycoside phosphotransferase family protein [Microbacterium sp. cf046]SFS07015.1 Predicted kinase, aminoglycoside phosphotransferase (APT) family [Microbacterium sp. cf046]
MPDQPAAELVIDEQLVRELVTSQAGAVPDAATSPLVHVADGWDCSVWRLGDDLAVRLPRRARSAPLVLHEQQVLAEIAERLGPSGVRVPAPVLEGRPGQGYPWSWSIVPWFDGAGGLGIPRARRAGWAEPLARALIALHVPAGVPFPANPVRGVPLTVRDESVRARLATLRGRVADRALARAEGLWDAALTAPAWADAPVCIHGDLHPGNIVARGSELVAIIDFGDVTAGDPAYDLAVAWLAFESAGRTAFIEAVGDRYDAATWARAHGWAAAFTLVLLDQSDDNPEYAMLGAEALVELTS